MTQANAPRDHVPAQAAPDALVAGDPTAAAAPYRPADDKEEIYFDGTPLFRAEIGRIAIWAVVGLVLIGLAIAGLVMAWFPGFWIAAIVLIVLGLLALVLPVLQLKALRYRISNYRIDYERGLLKKQIDTLELWHVDDISYEQGLIDRMIGVGTITVLSNDKTTPRLTLHGIPRPRYVFDSLKTRIIAVKRQRGVIKMDVGGGGAFAGD